MLQEKEGFSGALTSEPNNDNASENTSMSSVSVRSDDVQMVKSDTGDRKYVPVVWYVRLGRGIRGLWKTTATEGISKSENRDTYVRMTLRELMLYVFFLLALCLTGFLMLDANMYQFTKVMKGLFVDDPKFAEINTVDGAWNYLRGPLLDGLFWEKYYNGKDVHHSEVGYIFFENKLMGRTRLRQLRVKKDDSCVIESKMKKTIESCYADFSTSSQDQSFIGVSNDQAYNNSAWKYSSNEELQGRPFPGRLAVYPGGGYWRILSDEKKESSKLVKDLYEKNWINRGTRALFIEFAVYNANLNLFSLVTMLLEFPNTGAALSIYRFSTLKLLRYVTPTDYFVMALEGILLFFCLYYTIEEIIEISKHGLSYFKGVWNCVDILLLLLTYGCLAVNMYRTFEVNTVLESILKTRDEFANFGLIAQWQEYFNDLVAITLFLAWMKVFKYISFNQTMAELENTLLTCAKDVMGFCFMFMIFFFAYAQWGFIVFGSNVASFKNVGVSMLTLFRMILGDFDFMEIYNAKPGWGPVYFISYIFMVFFFLLNMFLAIVNDTYAEVKEEMDEEPFDVGAYFKEGFSKALNKLSNQRDQIIDLKDVLKNADTDGNNQIEFEEWRAHLKKRGHADFEIEALFDKFDLDGDRVLNSEEVARMQDELDEDEDEVEDDFGLVEKAKQSADRIFSKLMLRDENDDGASSESETESDDGQRYASSDEFKTLMKRVDKSEESVTNIVTKIESVLTKLEKMDKAKLKRRATMQQLIDNIIDYMDTPLEGTGKWKSEASFGNRIGSANTITQGSSLSIKVEMR